MERLTKTYSDGTHGASDSLPCGENSYDYKNLLIEKLGKYEDLEEQGRLVILPCKVRDIIYVVTPGCETVKECKVITVNYSNTTTSGNIFYIETLPTTGSRAVIGFYNKEIGKTVFLTKSEAEEKLKELRGGENER